MALNFQQVFEKIREIGLGAHAQYAPADPEWNRPIEPFRIAGNLYYVGSANVSSFLIATSGGLILLDTGFREAEPALESNIRKLGFRLEDVRLLLISHAHCDHVGAMAGLGVAADVGAAVALGLAVTVDAGVAATVAEALGPRVGSVGEAPKAAEVSPAANTRLNRTDAPERFTRDDSIPLLALSEHLSALRGAAVRTPNQLDGPAKAHHQMLLHADRVLRFTASAAMIVKSGPTRSQERGGRYQTNRDRSEAGL